MTTKVKMSAMKPKAVMPPIAWSTIQAGCELVLVDANGSPIGPVDPTLVSATLTSDNPAVTITTGTAPISFQVSKAAGTTGLVNLLATITYLSGAPGPFTSTIQITMDVVAASDLQIVVSGN